MKGGKFMVLFKAKIYREEKKATLQLFINATQFNIVLTEDKPNEVKKVFNNLLIELKKGEFNFELEESEEDLYFHVSKEYIKQLNSELTSIYKELKDYNLINNE